MKKIFSILLLILLAGIGLHAQIKNMQIDILKKSTARYSHDTQEWSWTPFIIVDNTVDNTIDFDMTLNMMGIFKIIDNTVYVLDSAPFHLQSIVNQGSAHLNISTMDFIPGGTLPKNPSEHDYKYTKFYAIDDNSNRCDIYILYNTYEKARVHIDYKDLRIVYIGTVFEIDDVSF